MSPLSISVVTADAALEISGDITSLYTDVFASPPWNEAFKCQACNKSFPRGQSNAVCCGTQVNEYYPFAETCAEIEQCFQATRARIALILDKTKPNTRLVGFAWGWEESIESLNKWKLNLPSDTFEELCQKCGVEGSDPLFYFSEFGVREELRGRGLGKQMYRELFSSIDSENARGILMRTSKQSPAFHVASVSSEYPLQVVHEYRDDLERVILSSLPITSA